MGNLISPRRNSVYWRGLHVELRAEAGFSFRLVQTGLLLREISPADELTHHYGSSYPRRITADRAVIRGTIEKTTSGLFTSRETQRKMCDSREFKELLRK